MSQTKFWVGFLQFSLPGVGCSGGEGASPLPTGRDGGGFGGRSPPLKTNDNDDNDSLA